MAKSCCFAVVLAVTCLSIILLSLDADAQPTVDETFSCGSSTLEEVARDVKDVKRLLVSNPVDGVTADPSKRVLVSALTSNCIPLLIQQNVDGFSFFSRTWADFKVGFNNSRGNYWLGNDLLNQLTLNGRYKLKFDLQSRSINSNWYSAEYSTFVVLSEADNYKLQVSGYSGNAGDAFTHHNGAMFSTYDRDNDQSKTTNCAAVANGGFWYKSCAKCYVNGARTGRGGAYQFGWTGLPGGRELQTSRMWLQCK